jgi:hypothetical protein
MFDTIERVPWTLSKAAGSVALGVAFWFPVAAQGEPPNRAAELFKQGQALLEAGRFGEACDKLRASDRLEPTVGTMGLLAACHERLGQVATAYREYLETGSRAAVAHDEREKYAKENAARLRPSVPIVTVTSAEPPTGLVVWCDSAPIALGADSPVDPGTHRIEARRQGRKPWHADVHMGIGERRRVDVPALEMSDAPAPSGAKAAPLSPSQAPAAEKGSSQWTAGWVALGIAAVGVGFGTGVGLWGVNTAQNLQDRDAECPEACNARNEAEVDSINRSRVISTISFVAGGVALATGVILLVTSPRRTTTVAKARAMVRPGALEFMGAF